MTKMTKKVAFTAALTALTALETEEAKTAAEIMRKELERLERVKSRETKAAKEKAAFRALTFEAVKDIMTHESVDGVRAADVASYMSVSIQKASAALNRLVLDGKLEKLEGEKRVTLFRIVK